MYEDCIRTGELREYFVARPMIPTVAQLALGAFIGLLAAEQLTWSYYCKTLETPLVGIIISVLLVALISIIALLLLRKHAVLLVILMILSTSCLFFCSGCLYWLHETKEAQSFVHELGSPVQILVTGDSSKSNYGFFSDGMLIAADGTKLRVRLYWQSQDKPFAAGSHIEAYGELKTPPCDEQGRRLYQNGYQGTINVHNPRWLAWSKDPRGLIAPLRETLCQVILAENIASGMDEPENTQAEAGIGEALVAGVVLGDRTFLQETSVENAFRLCGLSHLIAVSGSHLVIVSALATGLLRKLRVPTGLSVVLLVVILGCYTLLTGLQISAIRACLMSFASSGAFLLGRRTSSLASCSFCTLIIMCINPAAAFSFSFRLSVAAVMGIGLLCSYFESWLDKLFPRVLKIMSGPIALTLSAQIFTLPMTVSSFALLSLVSPLANIIVAPLVSILLITGLLVLPVALMAPYIGSYLLGGVVFIGKVIASLATALAHLPFACIPLDWEPAIALSVCILSMIMLWLFWPKPSRKRVGIITVAAACIFALAIVLPLLSHKPQIIIMDVGQGDAILVRDGTQDILIDTGPDNAALLEALARNDVRSLDAIIISHLHSDHYGALAGLEQVIPVGSIMFSQAILDEVDSQNEALVTAKALTNDNSLVGLSVGDCVKTDHMTLRVISPLKMEDNAGNQDSICLVVEYDAQNDEIPDSQMLLAGDAEKNLLSKLVDEGALDTIDILKVSHHGSAESLDANLLDSLAPQLALISVGENNDYGHPSASCLEYLHDCQIPTYRTDINGDLSLTFSKTSFELRCDTISS